MVQLWTTSLLWVEGTGPQSIGGIYEELSVVPQIMNYTLDSLSLKTDFFILVSSSV